MVDHQNPAGLAIQVSGSLTEKIAGAQECFRATRSTLKKFLEKHNATLLHLYRTPL
jgi:hypothetical protein